MTKTITPVSVWKDGSFVNAVKVLARTIDDNLDDSMVLYYELKDVNDVVLTIGNLTMMGTDYQDKDSNAYVWDWVAAALSLTYVV